MPTPPPRSFPSPPARTLAPHVSAAVGRTAQARLAEPALTARRPPSASPPLHRPAAHLTAAMRGAAQPKAAPPVPRPSHVQAALQRVAQAKAAPAPPSLRPAAPPRQRTLQMMEMENTENLPENITGMNRDGETVKTAGGTWKAVRYVAVERLSHAPAWGTSMTLEFTPEYPADATQISLVQTVTPFKNGEFYFSEEATKKRSFAGAVIDQSPYSRSPLYADDDESGDHRLGTSEVQTRAGQHGFRFWDAQNQEWRVCPAILKDVPHFRGVTGFSSQTFETTAIAVSGSDKGAYYGSVSWGWRGNGNGKVALDPLKVVSPGSASTMFKLAAKQWNQTATKGKQSPQLLPPVAPRQVNEVPVNRTRDNPTFTAITDGML